MKSKRNCISPTDMLILLEGGKKTWIIIFFAIFSNLIPELQLSGFLNEFKIVHDEKDCEKRDIKNMIIFTVHN